ncbi:Os03g0167775, partial [Oryza sativa Japonica Group]
ETRTRKSQSSSSSRGISLARSHLLLGERATLHQLLDLRVQAAASPAAVHAHGLHPPAPPSGGRRAHRRLELVAGGEGGKARARSGRGGLGE